MKQYLDPNGADFIMKKIRELKNTLLSKLDKSSKATSAEAKAGTDGEKYMTPATTKDAIGQFASKVEVVDNLTTSDSTKALSAKQGKALQDNKANKSDISRCKTKGYGSASSWQSVGSNRDLEDWIGDFDKRTRELKSGGSKPQLRQSTSFFSQDRSFTQVYWSFLKIGKIALITYNGVQWVDEARRTFNIPSDCKPLMNVAFECTTNIVDSSLQSGSPVGTVYATLDYNGVLEFTYPHGIKVDSHLLPFTIIYETAQ